MAFFTAHIETFGKDKLFQATLTWRLNQWDPRPISATLTQVQRVHGSDQPPFTWSYEEYVPDPRERRPGARSHILRIVAAPGVSIGFKNRPPPNVLPKGDDLLLAVDRVQDPALVPLIGTPLRPANWLQTIQANAPPLQVQLSNRALYPRDYYIVSRSPSSITFLRPYAAKALVLEVPSYIDDKRAPLSDMLAAFAYEFVRPEQRDPNRDTERDPESLEPRNPEYDLEAIEPRDLEHIPATPFDQRSIYLRVVVSSAVRVSMVKTPELFRLAYLSRTAHPRDLGDIPDRLFESGLVREDVRVTRLSRVPRQGSDLSGGEFQMLPKKRGIYDKPSAAVDLSAGAAWLMIDAGYSVLLMAMGPAGDLLDAAEAVYAVATDRDFFGRRVTFFEKGLMVFAGLLPYVNYRHLRLGRQLRRFGTLQRNAEQVVETLRNAKLDKKQSEQIMAFAEIVRKGGRLNEAQTREAIKLAQQIGEGSLKPQIADLVTADGRGLINAELQAYYTDYLKRKNRKPEMKDADPASWAKKTRGIESRRILIGLLGEDFAKRTGKRAQRLYKAADLPDRGTLVGERYKAALRILKRYPDLIRRRVPKVFKGTEESIVQLGTPLVHLTEGQLRNMKGNVGEALSIPLQIKVLKDFHSRGKKFKNAKLITGVRMKLIGADGKPKKGTPEFTDNIIATIHKGDIHIHAVFEVKSGYNGGYEGADQMYKWLEDLLTEESTLELTKKAREIDKDGNVVALSKKFAKVFTYAPTKPPGGKIRLLFSANRYLYTAEGISYIGLNSGKHVGPDVLPLDIQLEKKSITSAELDYLAGSLALGTLPAK